MSHETYRIVRFFQMPGKSTEVVKVGLTLREAQLHVSHRDSASKSATSVEALRRTALFGPWDDGYTRERNGTINGLAAQKEPAMGDSMIYKVYPDTYDGAVQMLREQFSGEVPDSCLAQKDERVDGVWLLLHPNGAECIVFLAGYEDVYGRVRHGNDAEFSDDWPTAETSEECGS